MSLVGLDLNASRARAVAGPSARSLALVQLDGTQAELALTVSLEDRTPRVGQAGFALMRARPHLVCGDFLPCLSGNRTWASDRHKLDADQALALAFASLAKTLGQTAGMVFTLPGYLDETQMARIVRLAEAARLPVLGSLTSPIAAVLASPVVGDPNPEPGLILVIDCDSHALSWSVVERRFDREGGQLRPRLTQLSTALGRTAWLRRLLDAVSHRCVRQTRRDPRESAATEQALFEQLSATFDQANSHLAQFRIQGDGWYHHLMFHAEEMVGLAAPLIRQVAADLDAVLASIDSLGPLAAVVVTHSAAGLPGLVDAVRLRCPAPRDNRHDDSADYGDLILATPGPAEMVHVLPIDALACMAHELALRIHRGEFPRGHLEVVALPTDEQAAAPRESGPARLMFRGQEHPLPTSTFSLGRDPGCDLVFESELYPHVSARHCEIVFDRRAYVLCDRSRHGTLLNDRPIQQQAPLHSGDWIRLGPRGPVLRFLGDSTTALPAAASNW